MYNSSTWIENISKVCSKDEVHIYSDLINFIVKNDSKGACHEISVMIFILLCEMGSAPELCIGECFHKEFYFDHSWVRLNGDIYDLAIINPLIPATKNPPIIK